MLCSVLHYNLIHHVEPTCHAPPPLLPLNSDITLPHALHLLGNCCCVLPVPFLIPGIPSNPVGTLFMSFLEARILSRFNNSFIVVLIPSHIVH